MNWIEFIIWTTRWLALCNPSLSNLITEYIGGDYLTQLALICGIRDFVDDPEFRQSWKASKQENKKILAEYVRDKMGIELSTSAVFDTQIKRIHEYKRQLLNIL